MEEIIFREVQPGEEGKICQLILDCFDEFVAPDYGNEGVMEFKRYVNPISMKARLEYGHFVLIAVSGEILKGVIEVRLNNHIALLFVKKEYQRGGIAKKLLELAIEKCRLTKHDLDFIEVNSSLYAEKIYERFGYTKLNIEQLVNGIRFIPMKLQLPNARFPG
jgi:GNAT superfamily N-acetyltransferase